MSGIRLKRFRGEIPRTSDDELSREYASESINCEFWSGKIRPWKALLNISATVQSAVKSIWQFSDNDAWFFEWTTDVDAVKGDIAADLEERTYYTGDGAPKVTSSSLALTGTPYPDDYYQLGLPAPSGAPAVTPQTNSGTITNITNILATGSASTITVDAQGETVLVRLEFEWSAPIDEADLGEIRPNSYVQIRVRSQTDNVTLFTSEEFYQPNTTHARASGTVEVAHTAASGNHVYEIDVIKSGFLTDAADITTYGWTIKRTRTFVATLGAGFTLEVGDSITPSEVEGVAGVNNENFEIESISGNDVTLIGAVEGAISGSGTWEQYWATEDLESRSYIFAYVAELAGKEMLGPPNAASVLVDVGQGQPVLVGGFPAVPAYDTNFIEMRIYRLSVGSTGTAEFFYVDTIGITGGVLDDPDYTDTKRAVDLGDQYQGEDWIAPPSDLAGITKFGDGYMVGFRKNEIHISDQYQFHAWPSAFVKPLSDNVVSIGVFGRSIAVATEGEPYVFTGDNPLVLGRRKIELGQACVSKRGSLDMGYGFVYPSNDGLVLITTARAELVTRQLFTIREWRALDPSSFLACRYDDRLVIFYDNGTTQGGFIMDPKEPDLGITFTDVYATAAYCDPDTGDLYLVVNDNIVKWDSAGTNLTYRWRSKRFTLDAPLSMSAAKVVSTAYPVQFRLWANDILVSDKAITGPGAFRVDTEKELFFQIEVEGDSGSVDRVYLAENMHSLRRMQQ